MDGFVKISEAASLAIHTMALLAREHEGHFTNETIARQLNASEHHLAKVMQRLVKAGMVESLRGPAGGFRLAAAAKGVGLLQIYEAIEGPTGDAAAAGPAGRPADKKNPRGLGTLMGRLQQQALDYLAKTTVEELALELAGLKESNPMVSQSKKGKKFVPVASATVRFAGDSGDGMQLAGSQFADIASLTGTAVCTLPDYPSEIRAPAGSLGGVSGFQLTFADHEVHTPGDSPYVLIAMNPAALKVSLPDLQPGGLIIVNEDEFTAGNLAKAQYISKPASDAEPDATESSDLTAAQYAANPLLNGDLSAFRVIPVAMTRLNQEAVSRVQLPRKDAARCKNFFALGLCLWLYDRPLQPVLEWLMKKFRGQTATMAANSASLRAGYNYADTAELFNVQHTVATARLPKGRYRRVTGNEAAALGLTAAAHRAGRTLVYASYPITPASEILHELSKYKEYDVRTVQTEDEIAACGAALGASFGGAIGATGTSGPGLALKAETLGLAVMVELPLVVINVQRAGPSTGMPTKTEQTDLMAAMYGRHGECPLVVLAAATPADCFAMVFEAVRLAVKYMTPVILLSDSFLANSAEPWRVPDPADLPDLRRAELPDPATFAPYRRDPQTLSRPWAVPGMAGFEHHLGGLEKQDVTGAVSYDAANHQRMTSLRQKKIEGISRDIPRAKAVGAPQGELLVVGWGSTYGPIAAAVDEVQRSGGRVAHLHLRYLNPFPANLGTILSHYQRVLVAENNAGQLLSLLRERFLVPAVGLSKVEGRPFRVREVQERIEQLLREKTP